MSRNCAEEVEVQTRDALPIGFRWRARRYAVREVLDHWVESGRWWDRDELSDAEREFWRVAAASNASAASAASAAPTEGVYDLCFDWLSARWALLRVMD